MHDTWAWVLAYNGPRGRSDRGGRGAAGVPGSRDSPARDRYLNEQEIFLRGQVGANAEAVRLAQIRY